MVGDVGGPLGLGSCESQVWMWGRVGQVGEPAACTCINTFRRECACMCVRVRACVLSFWVTTARSATWEWSFESKDGRFARQLKNVLLLCVDHVVCNVLLSRRGWSSTYVYTIPPHFPLALSLVSVTGCPPAPRPSLFSKEKELFQIAHI